MNGVKARLEPSLGARVVARTALRYALGADPSLDRPAHVRAGSALARLGPRTLAVVQDDASFVVLLEGTAFTARAVPLPAAEGVRLFDERRGNKHLKLDLEAVFVVGDRLVALGSGSTDARERIVLVEGAGGAAPGVRVVEARALYAALRSATDFAGAELNVEGAALAGEDVLLFQRGNGAPSATLAVSDATARIAREELVAYLDGEGPCPPLRQIVRWDLGALAGTRLTFTDGVALRGPWTGFVACAEASPDATRDGPVSGVALGRLDDGTGIAELAPVLDERGSPLLDKAEGVIFDDARAFLVIDRDDPDAPAELLELRLGEGWFR